MDQKQLVTRTSNLCTVKLHSSCVAVSSSREFLPKLCSSERCVGKKYSGSVHHISIGMSQLLLSLQVFYSNII